MGGFKQESKRYLLWSSSCWGFRVSCACPDGGDQEPTRQQRMNRGRRTVAMRGSQQAGWRGR